MDEITLEALGIIGPTIHLNGSDPEKLVEAYAEAHHALRVALEMLTAASPNARDYYTQPGDAFARASTEHRARLTRVDAVRAEIAALAENVQDQQDARARR